MSRHCRVTRLAVALGLVAGCQPVDRSKPPSLKFGEEACARCRMIISDQRFAASLLTEAGDPAKFDDVGCMIEYEAGGIRESTAYWVRDYNADAWLEARNATFVQSKRFASPMGFGFAAMRSPLSPGELRGESEGRTLRLQELPTLIGSGGGDAPAMSRRSQQP